MPLRSVFEQSCRGSVCLSSLKAYKKRFVERANFLC